MEWTRNMKSFSLRPFQQLVSGQWTCNNSGRQALPAVCWVPSQISCLYTQRMCPSVWHNLRMHACMCVCMYVCMYVCVGVGVGVCVCVCMYVNIFIIWTSYIFFITIRFHSLCVRIDIHLRKALQFSLSFHDTVDSTHRYAKLGCCRSLAGIFSCL